MAGVVKIEITESEEYLKKLLARTTGAKKERVQAWYWLKIGVVETTQHIAVLLPCHRTTGSRWLTIYREEGLEKLLEYKKSPGRPRLISEEALSSLKNELSEPEGFNSYGEIQLWFKMGTGFILLDSIWMGSLSTQSQIKNSKTEKY